MSLECPPMIDDNPNVYGFIRTALYNRYQK
jgi:hypothetical protein